MAASIKHELAGRLGLVYLIVMVIAAFIVVKALHVQIWEGDKWRKMGRSVSFKDFEVAPNRGNIYADDGRILASSVPYYSLRLDCKAIPDTLFRKKVDSLSMMLSRFFKDAPTAEYRKKLWQGKFGAKPNRYLLVNKKKISYTDLLEVKKFPIFRERGTKSGLILKRENVRLQPHRDLAYRTIGYLNEAKDGSFEGRVGIEGAFEKQLRGEPGRSIRQMMSGRWVSVTVDDPVDGNDVVTTINVECQDIVQGALTRQLEHYKASAGTAILMDVKTGDIKAIANVSKTATGYREVLNNAIGDAAEPGSVIKAATMVALLEDGYVHPEDTIDLGDGVYTHNKVTLKESKHPIGKVTVQGIFERSLNGITELVYEHYRQQPEKFVNRWYAMGLNKKVGIELAGEAEPYIKYPGDKTWSGTTLRWMSFGYELKITPLQVLAFYNALANDGKRMKPRIVKEIRNGSRVVERFEPEVVSSHICSRQTVAYMKQMMEGVVENGSAKNLKNAACKIAGKTGTAKVAAGSKGYNSEPKYRASFVGYFPADKPMYSCIVVVDNPSRSVGYYGNVVSGSVFKEIADKIYTMASLMGDNNEDEEEEKDETLPISQNGLKSDFLEIYDELGINVTEDEAEHADWVMTSRDKEGTEFVLKARSVDMTLVPNVKGMGLRDALYLLENSGLKVGVSGVGTVSQQSLTPGGKVRRGSYVHIELR